MKLFQKPMPAGSGLNTALWSNNQWLAMRSFLAMASVMDSLW
jgi:hypothetical protein